jgi:3-hydroxyacyl-[acyl-carrier-protein] dehydratase
MDSPVTMTFEEVKTRLRQRFPFIMVDRVLEAQPGQKIKAIKNVTGNEIQFLGHFPEHAIMPGVFMIEGMGQAACILFGLTYDGGTAAGDLLVLAAVNDMRFLVPVLPGETMTYEISIVKMVRDAALVEGVVKVGDVVAAKGRLSFARKAV